MPMDIRTFELGLRIKWQLPNSFSVGDYHVTFYATSTVRDLLDELLALKKWSGDYCLTRTVANIRFEDVSRTERISLPQNGLIVDQNIIDGTELVVERTAGNSPIVHNPTLAPEEDDPLCLVDETGTRRGRVSLLPKGRKITATTRPEASDCIVVDDARLINGTLMFEASDDDVEVSWEGDGFTLYLSGEQQVTKGRRIHVGTMVAVTPPNSPEDVRLSWLLTTASRAAQRTTQGRVRVEPRSRTSFPTYKSLPAALASLPGRPTASPPTPFPIDQVVLPVIMALALAAATQSLYMLVAAPIAVAGTVWSWRRNNRFREEADAKALVSWQSQIWSSLDALQNMAQSEHVSLGQEAPDSGYWTRAGYRRRVEIWSRLIVHDDFLTVRLGAGNHQSRYLSSLVAKEDELSETALNTIRASFAWSPTGELAPELIGCAIPFRLGEANIAVVGPQRHTLPCATDWLLQLVCSHSPSILVIAALVPEFVAPELHWLRWLPHLTAPSPLIDVSRFAVGGTEAANLLRELSKTLRTREVIAREGVQPHHLLLVIHESTQIDTSLLEDALEASKGAVHLLWIGSGKEQVPPSALWKLALVDAPEISGVADAVLTGPLETDEIKLLPALFEGEVDVIARSLAPLYDPRLSGASAGLPETIPLSSVCDLHVVDWSGDASESIRVLLGLSDDGPVYLDLVKDGPHTLIGGTTGSGKSELLQSIVCSLIQGYSPEEVSLFLVDYKGGSTFRRFAESEEKRVAHVVGFVADTDGPNVARAVKWLQAELRYRQGVFASADNAKEYEEYRSAQRIDPNLPLIARLVVIFDEFATLVASDAQSQGGSALNAVIDIAQRGRSYGVHLILATQSPRSDVVVPKVRSNVRAQIALATLSKEDSATIIGSGEAAGIPRSRPGRALLRLEGTSLQEFQSPFPGAPVRAAGEEEKLYIRELFVPDRGVSSGSKLERELIKVREFHVLIDTVRKAVSEDGLKVPAALEQPLTAVPWRKRPVDAAPLAIGVVDNPGDRQIDPLTVDFSRGSVVVQGDAGTGRTETLLSAAEAWLREKPNGVVFVLDGGSHRIQAGLRDRGYDWLCVSADSFTEISRALDLVQELAFSREYGFLIVIDVLERFVGFIEDGRQSRHWGEAVVELLRFSRTLGVDLLVSCGSDFSFHRLMQGNVGVVYELGQNFVEHNLAREDWLPGFGKVGSLTMQVYAPPDEPLEETERRGGVSKLLVLPAIERQPWWKLRTEGVRPDQVCVGTSDLRNQAEWLRLGLEDLLIVGRELDEVHETVGACLRQPIRLRGAGDSRVALSPMVPKGYEDIAATESDYVASLRSSGLRFEDQWNELSQRFLTLGNKLLVVVWSGKSQLSPSFEGLISDLSLHGKLCIIWGTLLGDGARLGNRLLREERQTLMLRPTPGSNGLEYSSVLPSSTLVHRPYVRYQVGQGILVHLDTQRYVWSLSGGASAGPS